MPQSEPTPQRSRIAAAKHRAEKAKTVILAAAVLAFFGAMAVELGAHHSPTTSGSRPAATSDESDDFGFDNGGLSPSQGQPSTSTQTS
jgi:hypothetical protein